MSMLIVAGWLAVYRNKVKQIQQLLSQNPSFGLRDVTKSTVGPSLQSATVTKSKQPVKRPSEEVRPMITEPAFLKARCLFLFM